MALYGVFWSQLKLLSCKKAKKINKQRFRCKNSRFVLVVHIRWTRYSSMSSFDDIWSFPKNIDYTGKTENSKNPMTSLMLHTSNSSLQCKSILCRVFATNRLLLPIKYATKKFYTMYPTDVKLNPFFLNDCKCQMKVCK